MKIEWADGSVDVKDITVTILISRKGRDGAMYRFSNLDFDVKYISKDGIVTFMAENALSDTEVILDVKPKT